MSHGDPIPLTPVPIGIRSDEFQGILDWPFTDAYVTRLLLNDIPQRVQFGNCRYGFTEILKSAWSVSGRWMFATTVVNSRTATSTRTFHCLR